MVDRVIERIAKETGIPVETGGGVRGRERIHEDHRHGEHPTDRLRGVSEVLAASIFHYGEFTIPETKAYLKGRGVEIRD